jgi:alpha-1,3-glucosyltransferase
MPNRYPNSPVFVIMDIAEKIYLAGFPMLLAFVTLFPAYMNKKGDTSGIVTNDAKEATPPSMEFLPLMMTSVYCAVGIVWGYLRLLFVYLNEEKTYQGQLSMIG